MAARYSLRRNFSEISPFLEAIRVQADSEREALGFLPEPAYAEAARQRKLILLLSESDDQLSYAGHLLFGGIFPTLYVTAPIAAIKGYAELVKIQSASPSIIWNTLGSKTAISKNEYDIYFDSCELAHALVLSDVMAMKQALSLETIRARVRGFHPPQFFCRLNGAREKMGLSSRKYESVSKRSEASTRVVIAR